MQEARFEAFCHYELEDYVRPVGIKDNIRRKVADILAIHSLAKGNVTFRIITINDKSEFEQWLEKDLQLVSYQKPTKD